MVLEAFNKYVKPPEGPIWDQKTTRIHDLSSESPQIFDAKSILQVWVDFCDFIHNHIHTDETCNLVAYDRETCNLKWLWKLTQALHTSLAIPYCIQFYMDPLSIIKYTNLAKSIQPKQT